MKLQTLFLALILLTGFSVASCHKNGLPACVENHIQNAKAAPLQNPPAEVWKWEVDGHTYYYFTSPCCDQFNFLYDTECNEVCAPDGGFTGAGDGKCPDFSGEITKTQIWRDERAE